MVNYPSGQAENVSQSHTETREGTETGRQARETAEKDRSKKTDGESPERSCPDNWKECRRESVCLLIGDQDREPAHKDGRSSPV